MKIKFLLLLCGILMMSCGARKRAEAKGPITPPKTKQTKQPNQITSAEKLTTETYIATYAPIAKTHMKLYKIPASITLAQGILESGFGNGRLAKKANNHFGIKCHGWKGKKIYHDDDKKGECFRKYQKAEDSYKDHSKFLKERKRYASLFKLKPNNYKGWAKGLRAAGYATDKKYPQKIITLIERYDLYKYDNAVLYNTNGNSHQNNYKNYTIEKDDTLYSLARLHNTTVEAIKTLNNLTTDKLTIGQVLKIPQ